MTALLALAALVPGPATAGSSKGGRYPGYVLATPNVWPGTYEVTAWQSVRNRWRITGETYVTVVQ